MLRVDPRRGSPYAIPAGNPFAAGGGAPEVWAYGLRNPYRFSFDRLTGDLLIGDVGQGAQEEVDRLPAGTGAGANLGWSTCEGNLAYPSGGACPLAGRRGYVGPAFTYGHTGGACSITGGYVVRDSSLATLYGRYLYGDFCTGRLGTVDLSSPATNRAVETDVVLAPYKLASFGEDARGCVYVALLSGEVYRLAAPNGAPPCPAPPGGKPPPGRRSPGARRRRAWRRRRLARRQRARRRVARCRWPGASQAARLLAPAPGAPAPARHPPRGALQRALQAPGSHEGPGRVPALQAQDDERDAQGGRAHDARDPRALTRARRPHPCAAPPQDRPGHRAPERPRRRRPGRPRLAPRAARPLGEPERRRAGADPHRRSSTMRPRSRGVAGRPLFASNR